MMSSEIVSYKADNGQDINVTEQDVRDLMAANGNAMDNVTSQEVKMFLRLCQSSASTHSPVMPTSSSTVISLPRLSQAKTRS